MSKESAVRRFEALVSKYGHVIRSAVHSVAGREAGRVAEDVEQLVLIELWKQIKNEQSIDHPSSYLYRAAIRETIRLARQMRRRSEEGLGAVEIADSNPGRDPGQRVESAEKSRRLRRLTDKLSVNRRDAVIAHLAGYRVQEIMEIHGWTYNRARNLIARGMADLRRALEEDDE